MNFFVLALCFLLVGTASANDALFQHEAPLTAMEFVSSGMPNNAPTVYIWDEQGETKSLYHIQDIRVVFSEGGEIEEMPLTAQQHKGFTFLKDYLADEDIWQQGKKVILLHVVDPQVGACPPCDEAEEIIETYLKNNPHEYVSVKTLMTN